MWSNRPHLHREADTRNQFSFVCIRLMRDRNCGEFFFTYDKESISYNSVYLISACVKNFVMEFKFNNETEAISTGR